ncbi:MAG: glycosyltransferase family protein [Planctomycetota bacterium]|jgi:glycosyltransferase involved in cell wall biosynthesis
MTSIDHERTLQVLLVTSPNDHCGIYQYGQLLKESVVQHKIRIVEERNPNFHEIIVPRGTHIIHVNHHAALHSSWILDYIRVLQNDGYKVVVTQHDTYETFEIMKERGFRDFRCADALVVHEPVPELIMLPDVFYFRQGVPAPQPPIHPPKHPCVGTIGFPFPWKRFDLLREAATEAGWHTLILDSEAQWIPHKKAIQLLSGCDATAFLHSSGNSGTSGVIRMGIAARKPVIATPGRQMTDLLHDDLGWSAIWWADTKAEIVGALRGLAHKGGSAVWTSAIEELADRDSWANLGRKYATIYRSILS